MDSDDERERERKKAKKVRRVEREQRKKQQEEDRIRSRCVLRIAFYYTLIMPALCGQASRSERCGDEEAVNITTRGNKGAAAGMVRVLQPRWLQILLST